MSMHKRVIKRKGRRKEEKEKEKKRKRKEKKKDDQKRMHNESTKADKMYLKMSLEEDKKRVILCTSLKDVWPKSGPKIGPKSGPKNVSPFWITSR